MRALEWSIAAACVAIAGLVLFVKGDPEISGEIVEGPVRIAMPWDDCPEAIAFELSVEAECWRSLSLARGIVAETGNAPDASEIEVGACGSVRVEDRCPRFAVELKAFREDKMRELRKYLRWWKTLTEEEDRDAKIAVIDAACSVSLRRMEDLTRRIEGGT